MRKVLAACGMLAVVLAITTGAFAAKGLITGADIKDGSITGTEIKNGSLGVTELSPAARESLRGEDGARGPEGRTGSKGDTGATGATGPAGVAGPAGPAGSQGAKGDKGDKGNAGDSYLARAYYAVAYYDVGDTNAGAIATVACSATTDTAISGGVSIDDPAKNVPVGQSFPGRMDWSTNTPKPGRLDGWIVQFAGDFHVNPEKVKVWALCVPSLSIPVVTTYTESG